MGRKKDGKKDGKIAKDYLTYDDIIRAFESGQQIDWHDDYQHVYAKRHPEQSFLTEEWVDRPGPLTITHVAMMDKLVFVRYKCSQETCRNCTDESLTLQGHHKLVRRSGLNPYGRIEFIERKKKTETRITDQPVFKLA